MPYCVVPDDKLTGPVHRRRFLSVCAASAGWLLLCAHSPYRQWMVYRETHLIILTSRDDLVADALGETFAAVVRAALPDSRARVGRGPLVQRIASLIATRQADVGVVSRANALAMYHGAEPFRQYGAMALRVLVQNDAHCLICREDFPLQHAYLLAEALMDYASTGAGRELGLSVPRHSSDAGQIPAHAGALAFAEARPLEAVQAR